MTYLPVAVAFVLAGEYDRRSARCTFTARFPRSARPQMIPDYLARTMLQDAYHQASHGQHHTPILRAYQALANQIERRASELKGVDLEEWRSAYACIQLRFVISQWVRSSRS